MDVGAIVLAGGLGSRMRPLTADCPKPLLPLAGEPLLGYQLRRLAAVGVHRVVIASGYLGEHFEQALGDGSRWGMALVHCVEEQPLGTGGAMRVAADRLPGADRVVVLNGDLLSSHDLSGQLAAARLPVTMHVRHVPDVAAYGSVRVSPAGHVERFAEKSGRGPGLVNAGTYVVDAGVLRSIVPGRTSWEHDLLPGLIAGGVGVAAWQGDGYFRDVGDPTAYLDANVDAVTGVLPGSLTGVAAAYVAPDACIAGDATLAGGCSIQPGATIEPGARLRACVVLAGATVGSHARLDRCIVLPGAVVAAGATAQKQVLGRRATFR